MARNFTSDQVINLIGEQAPVLGFYITGYADTFFGYMINAVMDVTLAGIPCQLVFKRDILHVSRLYSSEEIADMVKMLSATRDNIVKCLPSLAGTPSLPDASGNDGVPDNSTYPQGAAR